MHFLYGRPFEIDKHVCRYALYVAGAGGEYAPAAVVAAAAAGDEGPWTPTAYTLYGLNASSLYRLCVARVRSRAGGGALGAAFLHAPHGRVGTLCLVCLVSRDD